MRRTVVALALLAVFGAQARAQTDEPRPALTPFETIGDKVLETDWLAHLDNFAIELQTRPDTRAFIVAYGVPNRLPGWPLRRANWARGVLTKGRGLDPSRVVVVYGGYKDEVLYEHWILSPGESLPVRPFDFASALTREKVAYKFDQFGLPDPANDWGYDGSYNEYLDDRTRYEPLALALRQDPAARGLVIVYEGQRHRAGNDRRVAAAVKRAIMRVHALAPDRLVAVGGGRRDYRSAEIWIVPPGAALPKPTPTPRKQNTRRRPS